MRNLIIASSGILATFCSGLAFAAPPRLHARQLPVPAEACGWQGTVQGVATALGEDGSVAGVANCGTTANGSRMFFITAQGVVSDLDDGTFTFTTPEVIIGPTTVAGTGNWCPPLNGPCTTAVMVAQVGQPIEVLGSGDYSSVVTDGNICGWASGWGGVSPTDAWRIGPDHEIQPLSVPNAWGLSAEWIAETGWTAGHAYVNNQLRAIRWSPLDSVGTVLPSLVPGTASNALSVGLDGRVLGQSGGQAVVWDPNGTPHALMPAGSSSIASHIGGSALLATPLAVAYFGTHAEELRLFRADLNGGWTDLGPDASPGQTLIHIAVKAAPTPEFMVATAHTSMYEPVNYLWTGGGGLGELKSFVVDFPAGTTVAQMQLIDANALGQILVNTFNPTRTFMLEFMEDGDVNGDKLVDGADLGQLLGAWGAVPQGTRGACDFDGNGIVDGADLGVVLGAWSN